MIATATRRAILALMAAACSVVPITANAAVDDEPARPSTLADLGRPPEPEARSSPRTPPQRTSGRARFAVTLDSFRAIDESGRDWTGSDEVIGHFTTSNGADYYTDAYGDVDTGDLVRFRTAERCLAPRLNCGPSSGLPGPITLQLELWEDDVCNGFLPACFDPSTGNFPLDPNDDLIGRTTTTYTTAELVSRLDRVGDAMNIPFRLGGPCGHQEPGDPACGFGPLTATGPEYELRIVVKRVPDAPTQPRNSP